MSSELVNPAWARLRAPFNPADIEWRVSHVKKTSRGPAALVLAYVTARGVMNRLDEVVGPGNWQDEYRHVSEGVICRLSVRVDGEWIAHEDGAPPTDVEPFKGGISDALKRAAVKFGIGRYLYNLDNQWSELKEKKEGAYRHWAANKKDGVEGFWAEPTLPAWALPKDTGALSTGSNRGQQISAQNGQYLQNYVMKHAQEISVEEIRACISEFNAKKADFAKKKQAEEAATGAQ